MAIMTRRLLAFTAATCLGAGLGCAGKPPEVVDASAPTPVASTAIAASSTSGTSSAAPTSGQSAALATTTSPSATANSKTASPSPSTVKVVAHPPGSHRVVRNGQVMYCHTEMIQGSKIAGPEVCLTEEEAAEHERQVQDTLHQMIRPTLQGGFSPGPQPH